MRGIGDEVIVENFSYNILDNARRERFGNVIFSINNLCDL